MIDKFKEKKLYQMPTKTHEDSIFKEKRKPKTPIKFRIQLNAEQKKLRNLY